MIDPRMGKTVILLIAIKASVPLMDVFRCRVPGAPFMRSLTAHEWEVMPQKFHPPSPFQELRWRMPPRLKRYQHEGHLHFITFSCHRRLPYLDDDHARITFEETLETLRKRHCFDIHGYVVMPEHVHLLVCEPEIRSLDSTLRVLKGETSKRLKGDRDQFWQRRYYDFNVFTEPKRIEKIKYMHRNPVTRGLALQPEDWPSSSFRHYATGEPGRVEIERRVAHS